MRFSRGLEHHNNMTLLIGSLGQFNYERWRKRWAELFASHRLVHNNRKIVKINVSKEADGAFAVVDVDTLWQRISDGKDFHWHGRACKIYTKLNDKWKMISHTGLLDYSSRQN